MASRDPRDGVLVDSGVPPRTLFQAVARGMESGLLESKWVIPMLRAKGDLGQTTSRG